MLFGMSYSPQKMEDEFEQCLTGIMDIMQEFKECFGCEYFKDAKRESCICVKKSSGLREVDTWFSKRGKRI